VSQSSPSPERWLPVPGFEGFYEVSDFGRVRSVVRMTTRGIRGGGIRRPVPDRHGYLRMALSRYGKVRSRYVHRLVALAFIGPNPPRQEVRHGPGGKLDNRLVNLSYGTRADNENDKVRDGTFRHGGGTYWGERHHQSKLTAAIVLECRRRAAAGEQQTALALEFGISQSAMNNAILGKTWRHLT
jgi:hypothetical protein